MTPDQMVSRGGASAAAGPLTDAQIAAMSREQRVAVAARLMGSLWGGTLPGQRERERRRRWVMIASGGMALAMVPWVVILAFTLPSDYRAAHWDIAWVGFDLMMLASLALTAYFAWRRRLVGVLTAFATAIMLIVDAWFDVMTARGQDVWESIGLAVALEIPIALLLMTFAVTMIVRIARLLTVADGESPPESLWRLGFTRLTESAAAQQWAPDAERSAGR